MDCDEVCGCKKCNVTTWWRNSGVYDEIQQESVAYQEMTNHFTEEKNEYTRLKNAVKKEVTRAMKEEEVRMINEIGRNPSNVFRLVRKMKIESTDVVGGRCMRRHV